MNMLRGILSYTSAFLMKETTVALKQPRLIVGLIVGPFLLLLLFGLGFTGKREPFEAVLVVPEGANVPTHPTTYRRFFHWALHLTGGARRDARRTRSSTSATGRRFPYCRATG